VGLGLVRRLRVTKPLPPVVRATPSRSMPSVRAKQASTAYYNPSRIIDRSRLKIVDSIAAERQKDFAEERGDAVAPIGGGGSAPQKFINVMPEQVSTKPDIGKLIIPAIVAYFLFGG